VRLSKRMAELGLCSRREADAWIERGWVRVDGTKITELGSRVLPGQRIQVEPAARRTQQQQVTILLHKPIGIVSGQADSLRWLLRLAETGADERLRSAAAEALMWSRSPEFVDKSRRLREQFDRRHRENGGIRTSVEVIDRPL
jgi:ribosomal protein S4